MTEIVIHELSYYQELAAENHRGLVPMLFLQNAMPNVIGDIAGFLPKDARAMHAAGQAKPYLLEFEQEVRSVPRLSALSASTPSAQEIERLNAIEITPAIFAESKLAVIAAAKQIKGIPQRQGGINHDLAVEIIRAELSRRGQSLSTDDATRGEALQQQVAGAVTSQSGAGTQGQGGEGMGGQPPRESES